MVHELQRELVVPTGVTAVVVAVVVEEAVKFQQEDANWLHVTK